MSGNQVILGWPSGPRAHIFRAGSYLDVRVSPGNPAVGGLAGLLGSADGDHSNDLLTRAGSPLAAEPSRDQFYGEYAESWRVLAGESLFDYADGETTETFTDRTFPGGFASATELLSEAQRREAEATCRAAGVTDPVLLQACVLDVGLTGDSTFSIFPAGIAEAPKTTLSIPGVVLPYQTEGYRYQVVSSGGGAGYEAPGFDDTSWPVGAANFGFGCGGTAATAWPAGTDILLRRTVAIPEGTTRLAVQAVVDNDVQVFWNGTDISGGMQIHEGCASYGAPFTFSVPQNIVVSGDNLLAVRGRDRGGQTFLDLQVTGFTVP